MEGYSVLMAVYHRERPEYLRQAVQSMVSQSLPPEEFVLVCDGPLTPSLDAVIADLVLQYPALFRVVRLSENRGLGAALNIGLTHCRRGLVARMDSDDLAVPERMALLLAELERHPQASVVGGQIAEFDRDPQVPTGYRTVPCQPEAVRRYLKRRSPMNHTTTLLRRDHILEVGGYGDMTGSEDYLLWAKLLRAGRELRNIPQVCCAVRADAGMYRRRGGWGYFRNALVLQNYLLREKLITPGEYLGNVLIRIAGNLLLPASWRRAVFLRFLRKKALDASSGAQPALPSRDLLLPGLRRDRVR